MMRAATWASKPVLRTMAHALGVADGRLVGEGPGVGDRVALGVRLDPDGVSVGRGVSEGGTGVLVGGTGVWDGVHVGQGVLVGVWVAVWLGVRDGVQVGEAVSVGVLVSVGVSLGVGVLLAVMLGDGLGLGVSGWPAARSSES